MAMNINIKVISQVDKLLDDIIAISNEYLGRPWNMITKDEFNNRVNELVDKYKMDGLIHERFELDHYLKISFEE